MSVMEQFRLNGRRALVTGASSGLGRHFALSLAQAGASVIVAARSVDKLEETVAEIEAAGGKAFAVPLDVTDLESVKTASNPRAELPMSSSTTPAWRCRGRCSSRPRPTGTACSTPT